MKMVLGLFAAVSTASLAAGQTLVGALAIDEGRGDQYGWAVDDERARAARQRALSACASGCSVVLTFERCAAYAADQEGGSSAFGWAESYGSSVEARQRAQSECGSGAVRVARFGCGAATARWWREGWVWTVRRVARFRRACKPRASTLAELTGGRRGQRVYHFWRWRFVAGSGLSADEPSPGDLRELG